MTRKAAFGRLIALGFECPLHVPLANEPAQLTSARRGEGNRAWCAGAGAGALATGLSEVPWLLRAIGQRLSAPTKAFIRWSAFAAEHRGLFLWEAFVTAAAKRDSHANDAVAAIEVFRATLPDPDRSHALQDADVVFPRCRSTKPSPSTMPFVHTPASHAHSVVYYDSSCSRFRPMFLV
jgi:hypothetical protein